jgi:putative transposase
MKIFLGIVITTISLALSGRSIYAPKFIKKVGEVKKMDTSFFDDNVFIKRLWRSVKYEDVYLKAYGLIVETRENLREYFKFYNSRRRHQSLYRKTPDNVYRNILP